MKVIKNIREMQSISEEIRRKGKKIGFVPTMGYLHPGHVSLIQISKEMSDITIVSIYVNPTQFAPNEDLDKYPRDFDRDRELCQESGVDFIFYPENDKMYLLDHNIFIISNDLSNKLCGVTRPDHFKGVTTIVGKLFNIVKPHFAVFGQKDAQQGIIIKKMVEDLNYDIKVVLGPIIRESNGLAMSSRNKYLTEQERSDASNIFKIFQKVQEKINNGEKKSNILKDYIQRELSRFANIKIDYIAIVNTKNLEPVETVQKESLIAIAVFIGKTRLIDNIILN